MEPTVTFEVPRWIVDNIRNRMVEDDDAQIVIDPFLGTLTAMINWRPIIGMPLRNNPLDDTTARG